ncbi:hypothetical protein HanRHA438_Chr15g0692781 [Helianthus annuus]|nr:hypothetical protein HanRHA438_Chr15g0692781 [Helianthus annuus]
MTNSFHVFMKCRYTIQYLMTIKLKEEPNTIKNLSFRVMFRRHVLNGEFI